MSEPSTEKPKEKPTKSGDTARELIRQAKKASRRKFPADEKIRIVMEGVRGEIPVSELCRREGIHATVYYKWLKDFMEAGKSRLRGDTLREATKCRVARPSETLGLLD